MSLNMNAEQSTKHAHWSLFSRFVVTVVMCFAVIQVGIGLVLVYHLDREDKKLMRSLGAEYQRILTFESDDKFEHVVINNPHRLIENAISVTRIDLDGRNQLVSGAEIALDNIDLAHYQLPLRYWYNLFSETPYLSVKLSGESNEYWLVLNVNNRMALLYQQWLWMAITLGVLCCLVSCIVWRLIRTTLLPLHSLAKGLDQASTWSIDAMPMFEPQDTAVANKNLGVLNQSVNQVLVQLKSTIISMGNTLDAIAHDLRTPLSRIVLTTEKSLLSTAKDNNLKLEMQSALSDCAESAQQASQMLNTLMKINDEVIGQHKLEMQSIDLKVFIEHIISWYEELAEDAEISISTAGLETCFVTTEPNRLTQIMVNLIDNSFKYSEANSQITLHCGLKDNGYAFIEVIDTGIGIDKEHHALIFTRLYRVDPSRTKAGYGLGLPLVKVMLETLQGRINVSSESGKGSCFTVYLPVKNVYKAE
ncbi:HAMP domain-containing histidine kinase [Photobacterium profundum]|uniref:sensor histidine kinase n=1 Tax=Photobacterium profundum TaxID=74109 RepID=UPI003D13C4B3